MGPGISVRFGHCPNTILQDQSHSISSFMHRLLSKFINSLLMETFPTAGQQLKL